MSAQSDVIDKSDLDAHVRGQQQRKIRREEVMLALGSLRDHDEVLRFLNSYLAGRGLSMSKESG